MEDFTYEQMLGALEVKPRVGRLEVDCFIERVGLEWEYLVHVEVPNNITVRDLLDEARRVLIHDPHTLPAEWIHASIESVSLRGKGNTMDNLYESMPLWKVEDVMAERQDPAVIFRLSPIFEKRYVQLRTFVDSGSIL